MMLLEKKFLPVCCPAKQKKQGKEEKEVELTPKT
jgi:hypothetical protein